MTAHTQLLVYNSENRFVGFFYQFTCRVERTKGLKDKTEFWDRLFPIDQPFRLYLSTVFSTINKKYWHVWHIIWDILVILRIEYDDDDRSGNWQRQLRVTIGCTGVCVTCMSLPTPFHWWPWWGCSLWGSWRAQWGWSLWASWWEFRRLTALVPFDLSVTWGGNQEK